MTGDQGEQHSALTTQQHMRDIASMWPELVARLGGSSGGDNAGVHTVPGSKMPIDAHMSDVMAEVSEWAAFLAHVLIDETDWTPRSTDTAVLLYDISEWRIGHFTEHPDEHLRIAIEDDAKRLAKLVRNTVRPSGRRKIRLGTRCLDYGTSDLGERIVCTGEYETILDPAETIGDLVCSKDPQHRMTPLEWQRAQRHDPARDRDMDALLYGGRLRHRSERMSA